VADPRRPLTADLAWIAWATADDPGRIAQALARGRYLHALTAGEPRVLADLQSMAIDDVDALRAWAERWRLPAWACAWGRATITLSRGRYWCPPLDGGPGAQIPDQPPTPAPLSARQLATQAPIVHPEAFRWLAAYQLGASWLALAMQAQLTGGSGTSAGDVQRDCVRLARLIELELRHARRGRPSQKNPARPPRMSK
jgi:hypothetical protein